MAAPNANFRIVCFPGDGIGQEIIPPALALVETLSKRLGGFSISIEERRDCGATYFLESGRDCSTEAFDAARSADAILLGAIGLPNVRLPGGTEISPHLRMREEFGLSAGVRPVKAYANTPRRLLDERAASIDLIVLRESSEGLFHTQGRGVVIDDREARETLLVTRPVTERLCDTAFELARKRKARGGKGRVTCVDKANVFNAFAFFRKIFDERAALNPDILADHNYVDAMALDLIRKPWEFDILVMENMFGDILSDLGGGLVGGMGMAPCAELGTQHGLFQPAHGSAPDIAGQDKANPTATFLATAMMLDWLADRHSLPQLAEAAGMLDRAIERGFTQGRLRPMEFGGEQGLKAATQAVIELLDEEMIR